MDRQFGEVTRSNTFLADARLRRGPAPSQLQPPDDAPAGPRLTTPGLVLVATLAIFNGYHLLHLLPTGSFGLTALLSALCAAPATFALTRHADTRQIPGARIVARSCAAIGLTLGPVVAIDQNSPFSPVLGVTSLVLAASLVALAYGNERRRPSPTDND